MSWLLVRMSWCPPSWLILSCQQRDPPPQSLQMRKMKLLQLPVAKCWNLCQNGVIITTWHVKKRSILQIIWDNFAKKSANLENNTYKLAFKAAIQELYDDQNGPSNWQRGYGAITICKQYNNKFNLDGVIYGDLKLQTIQDAVNEKCTGLSLLKIGWQEIVPPQSTMALVTQSTMTQVAATNGESSDCNMIPLIKAMATGTIWEGKFSAKYAWRRAQKDHPEHFVPEQAKNHKDRNAEWLTVQK